jgi:hypothetical protein
LTRTTLRGRIIARIQLQAAAPRAADPRDHSMERSTGGDHSFPFMGREEFFSVVPYGIF